MPLEEQSLMVPAAGAQPPVAAGGTAPSGGTGPLVSMLRRRWALLLAVWLLLAPAGVVRIWMTVRPTYRAVAKVEISPVVPAILRQDVSPMPYFDVYLSTQAQLVASPQVVKAALDDRATRDLPIQQAADPVVAVQVSLEVSAIARTNLLEIAVTQQDRRDALVLAKAVLDAYLAQAVGLDAQQDQRKRDVLEAARKQLRDRLDGLDEQIGRLADQYGTSSESTFETLRTNLEAYSAATRQEYERAELEVLQIQERMHDLDQGGIPEDLAALRASLIEVEPGLTWVREEIRKQAAKLSRLRTVLPEGHKDIDAAQLEIQRLQTRLDQEYGAAARSADREIARRSVQRAQETRARLERDLAAATHRREVLKARVTERNAEAMAIGRHNLQIQALREQRDQVHQEYEQLSEAIRRQEFESQRPARIKIASEPQLPGDGVRDRRKKLSLTWVAGCFVLSFMLCLVRDRMDPRLREVQQLEEGMGLRLLGVVPALSDLRARRVTKEAFLDSYRLIRTTLSALQLEGRSLRTFLITSAQACEGKTSLTVSLAISLAETGCRVLLVDGDAQVPRIARIFNLTLPHSLSSVLKGRCHLAGAVAPSGVPGVDVLGNRNNGNHSTDALNVKAAARLLKEAVGAYDYVLVDSPPALGAADALVWARAADGVILSSLMDSSDTKAVRLTCQRLACVRANVLGTVIANVSTHQEYYSYSTASYSSAGLVRRGGALARRGPPLVQIPPEPPDDLAEPIED